MPHLYLRGTFVNALVNMSRFFSVVISVFLNSQEGQVLKNMKGTRGFHISEITPESSRQGVGTGLASSNLAASHYLT